MGSTKKLTVAEREYIEEGIVEIKEIFQRIRAGIDSCNATLVKTEAAGQPIEERQK